MHNRTKDESPRSVTHRANSRFAKNAFSSPSAEFRFANNALSSPFPYPSRPKSVRLLSVIFKPLALASLFIASAFPSQHSGQVLFSGGLPVPGATVTAVQGDKKLITITDQQGIYNFTDLPDGIWTLTIEMTGFSAATRPVTVAANAPREEWALKLLPFDQVKAAVAMAVHLAAPAPPPPAPPAQPSAKDAPPKESAAAPRESKPDDESAGASDGLLINGSTNNGAASPFAQFAAFGNRRSGSHGLYNGGIGILGDISALDARSFSLTGQDTAKPAYTRLTGVATLGGPIKIPHLLRNGPVFFLGYQWTRNRNATATTGLMPTLAERTSLLPASSISPQALALLSFYPLPNFAGSSRYNYQIPLVSATHQDALQSRLNKSIGQRNQLYSRFSFQDARSSTPNLFDFLDTSHVLGLAADANWSHRFGSHVFTTFVYQFSRLSTHNVPYFENRENVSGNAGISGNNQSPVNWGPPSLSFSSGISGLSDGLPASNHNQTGGLSDSTLWVRGRHYITFGGDLRKQQFNYLSQQNPRGSFGFTGAAAGSDFADFLLGVPDTSAIAFGNADKYFRQSGYDAFFTDDWRITPEFSVNAGMRWEYGAPVTELYGRLVNLAIAPGFTSATPVVAHTDPNPLIQPDKRGIEPRIGIAWRPLSGSSLVVRGGYGVYYNTSVYQSIATQMAQQAPLSKSFSVSNSAANPLTLANGFILAPSTLADTFAVDPNFRIGYAQNWQLAVQRDLPASLQMTATYLGIKGTRGMQEFLPNTFPAGGLNPCPSCPSGYAYLASNGNSSREAAQFQLRRRLHSGITATLQYVFSKSIDDDSSLGGQGFTSTQSAPGSGGSSPGAALLPPAAAGSSNAAIAQNWLALSAERSRSSFDQRHLLSAQIQYTTGMGLSGGTLLTGWKAAFVKEWTVATLITAGSGLPETPTIPLPTSGTGFTGALRPDYTGAPLYNPPAGLFLNPAAYSTPLPGQWGNAGRNTINGPAQFSLNASLGRTFRVNDRLNLDLRLDSANALNHVVFNSWNTTVTSAQFGLPTSANNMRSVQTTLRLRF